ncbi:4-alpha-glucanotransferase [Anaerobranca californiensis DSM 14826]|uniref:4-alpha-glucanotransferase n=2 Tax=Anaerobranca TaxID=42447 RepID=A0A1M6KZ86_9FIRM|nr:4-alpha-glucanotransferase [Anaerobranca californiensis]SHJ64271.1 4-alpha-glucanotransferase [Anaerobranca californiensis DSM 14826]
MFKRSSGILLHPTSLPSPHGIGDLGKGAYDFVDFLVASKQKLWQILPLGPTGFGDSPYQCFSAFAGNPLLISLDKLVQQGFLKEEDINPPKKFDDNHVEFGEVINFKFSVYKKAYNNFKKYATKVEKGKYENYCHNQREWLEDYALFMALKEYHKGAVWNTWDKSIAKREASALEYWQEKLKEEIGFQKFIQYIFYEQWMDLKSYANKNFIEVIGDIPIFVAFDSADVWSRPELFCLDEKGYPTEVAGVPPDYFSLTGQLWGNPLYNWDKMQEDDYRWWIDRFKVTLQLVDIVRLDHFRGFEAYWAVPYGEKTAVNGTWRKGPGADLFSSIEKALGKLPIIAEDLGFITKEVHQIREQFNFPGMKILQFAFDSKEESDVIPHKYEKNSVVYTGTHDNDTILGWFEKASPQDREYALKYAKSDGKDISWDIIQLALSTVCNIAIIPLQDLLSLGAEGRMNIPGTTSGNWTWRFKEGDLTENIAQRLATLTKLYGRY